MPLVYADTSALFAYLHPRDEFALLVTAAVRSRGPDFVYWSFLKFELRHNLRQNDVDRYGRVAWNALRAAEATRMRFRWLDLKSERVLESAESLSQQHAKYCIAGSADFYHVAAARKADALTGIDEFWTCDAAQASVVDSAGLKTRLFELAK